MNDFRVIYKILKALKDDMDYDEFDMDFVSVERLKITENRLLRLWEMLVKNGYVEGVNIKYGANGDTEVSVCRPKITLQGLAFLEENSLMRKATNLAKGIVDVIAK